MHCMRVCTCVCVCYMCVSVRACVCACACMHVCMCVCAWVNACVRVCVFPRRLSCACLSSFPTHSILNGIDDTPMNARAHVHMCVCVGQGTRPSSCVYACLKNRRNHGACLCLHVRVFLCGACVCIRISNVRTYFVIGTSIIWFDVHMRLCVIPFALQKRIVHASGVCICAHVFCARTHMNWHNFLHALRILCMQGIRRGRSSSSNYAHTPRHRVWRRATSSRGKHQCVCMYVYVYAYVCMNRYASYLAGSWDRYINTWEYLYLYVHVYVWIYTYIHIYIYICVCRLNRHLLLPRFVTR
jgi:hypothetical protein